MKLKVSVLLGLFLSLHSFAQFPIRKPVQGPYSTTLNSVPVFDTTLGSGVKESPCTIDTAGNLVCAGSITGTVFSSSLPGAAFINLSGDVVGAGSTAIITQVNLVGGKTSTAIAQAVTTVQAATNSNSFNTLVKRDGNGDFESHDVNLYDGLNLYDSNSVKVKLAAPLVLVSPYTFTFPTNPGTNGYVLKTDGAGHTSWTLAGSGGGVWGTITGLLSDQVDLQAALDGKVSSVTSNNAHVIVDNSDLQNPILGFADFIESDPAAFFAASVSGSLIDGWYMIRRANGGQNDVLIHVQDGFDYSTSGYGKFLNPDFQDDGVYTGIPTATTIGAYLGPWFPALTPSIGDITLNASIDNKYYTNLTGSNTGIDPSVDTTNWAIVQRGIWSPSGTYFKNQVVIWDGIQWANLTDINTSTEPPSDIGNWMLLIPAVDLGYLTEWDVITYVPASDEIRFRKDTLGNEVNSAIQTFQWGNRNCSGNIVKSGAAPNIINQMGIISGNVFQNGASPTLSLVSIGSVQNCEFSGSFVNYTYPPDISVDSKVVKSGLNTFQATFDATGGGTIDLASANYAGIFNLTTSNTVEAISKIKGLDSNFPTRFNSTNGKTFTFQHAAILTAGPQDIVLENNTDVPLVGRNTVSDNIILENINGRCAQVGGAVY